MSWDVVNFAVGALTLIAGPALGYWVAGKTRNPRTGLVVGLLATPKILLVSFLLWTFTGIPDYWGFIAER
ncbi:hypothetical protein [Terrihabitans rhizophilus]|jgi:hypothetical protein|uniref:Uncharacterized protein n=1 Tax=Terrihabitans rhizophilus TaxID=3092662 RepID=A0ABU4RMN7_9HYPH|nr:hypothetical protein [Terrihabitans sp. PJ23]MDX6804930.1 hypothetical protein [Terrihabitans sp. PJ23]